MKFSKTDISMDDLVKEFFLAKNIRETTKNHYLMRLSYYCSFIGKAPSEMIEEAETEEEERLRMRKRKIKDYFLSWLEELQKNNYSRSSISSYFASVKSFYRFFEIELPPNFRIESNGNNSKAFEKIPTREDIKKAIQYSNLKYKAIILLMASSGMGSAEVRNLTYKDFLGAIKEYYKPIKKEQFDIAQITENLRDRRHVIPTWKINRYKTKMPYITFSTPESVEALLRYMNSRNKEYPFKALDDWIFLADGKQTTGSTLAAYFNRLNEKADFENLDHTVFFHSHALRKFFGSKLHEKGIQRLNYDFMMGHKIDQIADAYIKPNVEALKREYTRCLEELSIESVKVRRIESEEVKNIVNELNEKDKRLKDMEKKQEVMEEMLKKMMSNQLNNEESKK
ncbi:tyrosine-type recombinase/integrase [Methanobacterium aggregans]|uniref:tyrosine-type recombinase/integrase n=1 Tax=Methanobacterium aggregans TaxID=1615586 RepID=UPI00320D9557